MDYNKQACGTSCGQIATAYYLCTLPPGKTTQNKMAQEQCMKQLQDMVNQCAGEPAAMQAGYKPDAKEDFGYRLMTNARAMYFMLKAVKISLISDEHYQEFKPLISQIDGVLNAIGSEPKAGMHQEVHLDFVEKQTEDSHMESGIIGVIAAACKTGACLASDKSSMKSEVIRRLTKANKDEMQANSEYVMLSGVIRDNGKAFGLSGNHAGQYADYFGKFAADEAKHYSAIQTLLTLLK
jgi:hypothetical protein